MTTCCHNCICISVSACTWVYSITGSSCLFIWTKLHKEGNQKGSDLFCVFMYMLPIKITHLLHPHIPHCSLFIEHSGALQWHRIRPSKMLNKRRQKKKRKILEGIPRSELRRSVRAFPHKHSHPNPAGYRRARPQWWQKKPKPRSSYQYEIPSCTWKFL